MAACLALLAGGGVKRGVRGAAVARRARDVRESSRARRRVGPQVTAFTARLAQTPADSFRRDSRTRLFSSRDALDRQIRCSISGRLRSTPANCRPGPRSPSSAAPHPARGRARRRLGRQRDRPRPARRVRHRRPRGLDQRTSRGCFADARRLPPRERRSLAPRLQPRRSLFNSGGTTDHGGRFLVAFADAEPQEASHRACSSSCRSGRPYFVGTAGCARIRSAPSFRPASCSPVQRHRSKCRAVPPFSTWSSGYWSEGEFM